MKNLLAKFIVFLCVLSNCVTSHLLAQETVNPPKPTADERVNISPNELLVTEKGLFLMRSGEALPLTAVFADVEGLYILVTPQLDRIWNTCLNGHEIYHQECGGCANWWCSFRCKCYSPW